MALKMPGDLSASNLNINISAYRVLFILSLLVRYRSLGAVDLNRFLVENPLIQRIYNAETLTKYINTLREVGCAIPRSSNRNDYCYELLVSPFPLRLEQDELQVAEKLLGMLFLQPDEALCNDYSDFLAELDWCLGRVDRPLEPVNVMAGPAEDSLEGGKDLAPALQARRHLLKTYRRYCQETFTLQIMCREQSEPAVQERLIEPHDVMIREDRLLLRGLDQRSQQCVSLDLEQIVSVRQLPGKSRRSVSQVSVTFALYGRLAKSYRLHPGEKVIYQSETEQRIKARVSDSGDLINRLMKYGASCQVLAPASVRDAMRQRIDNLLNGLSEAD